MPKKHVEQGLMLMQMVASEQEPRQLVEPSRSVQATGGAAMADTCRSDPSHEATSPKRRFFAMHAGKMINPPSQTKGRVPLRVVGEGCRGEGRFLYPVVADLRITPKPLSLCQTCYKKNETLNGPRDCERRLHD